MRVALLVIALLTGCGSVPTDVRTVRVPVPIKCESVVPEEPVWPTSAYDGSQDLLWRVRALISEIEMREAYEARLVAALAGCGVR